MKIRIKESFSVIPNGLLNDKRLSFKAKGLWAYIHSKPDGWDFSAERIALDSNDGRDAIRSALRELEEFGYLSREKQCKGKRKIEYEYVLLIGSSETENPSLNNLQDEAGEKGEPDADAKDTQTDLSPVKNPSSNKERNTKKELVNSSTVSSKLSKKDEAKNFFATDIDSLLINLNVASELKEAVRSELLEFIDYWTEENSRGKQLWETKPTFEVQRRLKRWFRNSRQFGKRSPFLNTPRVNESVSSL